MIMYQIIIPLLTFISVLSIGGAAVMAVSSRREALATRRRLFGDLAQESAEPVRNRMHSLVDGIGKMAAPAGPTAQLREKLARAGHYSRSAPGLFLGSKVLCLLAAGAGVAILILPTNLTPMNKMLLVFIAAAGASFAPNVFISVQQHGRQSLIRRHLPDAIDLLEISVNAGMGIDMAWNSVTEEIRRVCGVLADEMALTNLEIHLGATRAAAMRHMAERTGADEIASLVSVLVQSERFGTSVAEAMRSFASSMRETRAVRAAERAEKMAIQLLFPMIVFIFPVILIVTAGPAGIKIWTLLMQ